MGEARDREKLQVLDVFVRRLRRSLERTFQNKEDGSLSVNGGILSERLRVARGLEVRIARLLRHLNVIVTGRNATHKAALINELMRAGLSSNTAYLRLVSSVFDECTEKYHISSEFGDVADEVYTNSLQIDGALKCLGIQESDYRGACIEFLPEMDNFFDSHIVYKVQFGLMAKVTVEFESFEGVEQLLNLGMQNERELHGEEVQMQAFVRAEDDGKTPLHFAAVLPALHEDQILRERLDAMRRLFDETRSAYTTDGIQTYDFIGYLLGKYLNYAPQVSSNCADLLAEHIGKIRNFIDRCATKQNHLWSVIKAITVQLPGSDTAETDVAYVNLPDVRYFHDNGRTFHSEILEESRALIYVCDERKTDGDYRWLLRKYILAHDLSKGFCRYQLYTVIVSKQVKRFQSARGFSLKSRLCRAKQAELHSILAEHVPVNLTPNELKMSLNVRRLKIFTLAVGDVCGHIDSIKSLLRAHLRASRDQSRVQLDVCEQKVSVLCDDLMCADEGRSILKKVDQQRRTYFADQVLTTFACSRDILSRVDLERAGHVSSYESWSKQWFSALISSLECSSTHVFQHIASVESFIADPPVLYSKENCSGIKETFATGRLRSLQSYSRFLDKIGVRTKMMKLGELNSERLRQFCADFSRSICGRGLHKQSRKHLKRLVWIFFHRCRRYFDHFLANESFADVVMFHAVSVFHENLVRNRNLILVGHPESVQRIIDDAHFDMIVIVFCRLRVLQYIYQLAANDLQGVRSLARSLHDVATAQFSLEHMKFPLYCRHAQSGRIVWMHAHIGFEARSAKKRKLHHITRHGAEGCAIPQVSKCRIGEVGSYDVMPHTLHTVCHISALVLEGLKFIEREALRRDTFFKIWGSDLLATFLFFREISTGLVHQVADQILRKFAIIWLSQNSCVRCIESFEDFLFYSEGCYVLHSLGMEKAEIRGKLEYFASMFNSQISKYLGLRTKPGVAGVEHPNKPLKYDQLSTAMVWSFFLRGNGLQIDGTSSQDITHMLMCYGALELQTNFATAAQFRDVCYFVTHRVFTSSSWCQFALNPEEWQTELKFLRYYLPSLVEAADVELVGEFVQALRCIGVSPLDVDMLNATTFLLHARNSSTGGWLSANAAFETQYHATVCSIGALMKHSYKNVVSVQSKN